MPVENWIKRVLTDPELTNRFDVLSQIGYGSFGRVWEANIKCGPYSGKKVAIKAFKPFVEMKKIYNEVELLEKHGLGEENNVIELIAFYKSTEAETSLPNLFIIMPLVQFTRFRDIVVEADSKLVLKYIWSLLRALEYLHSFGIIHRDIKPSNFLCDSKRQIFRLIDFGLTETKTLKAVKRRQNSSASIRLKRGDEDFVDATVGGLSQIELSPKRPCVRTKLFNFNSKTTKPNGGGGVQPGVSNSSAMNLRMETDVRPLCKCFNQPVALCKKCLHKPRENVNKSGTAGYRSVETLLAFENQSTGLDIWAAGIILLSLLSRRSNFFRPKNDQIALCQIISLIGFSKVDKGAKAINKCVTASEHPSGFDLELLCFSIRNGSALSKLTEKDDFIKVSCESCSKYLVPAAIGSFICLCTPNPVVRQQLSRVDDNLTGIPPWTYKLLEELLDPNCKTRISATNSLYRYFPIPPP